MPRSSVFRTAPIASVITSFRKNPAPPVIEVTVAGIAVQRGL